MRQSLLTPGTAVLAAAGLVVMLLPAHAQVPSTEEITRSLRPDSAIGTRGIREIAPPAATAQPPAVQPTPYAPSLAPPATTSQTPYSPPSRPTGVATVVPRIVPPSVQANAAPAVSLTVTFLSGSAELSPSAHLILDNLGRALTGSALAAYRFRIEGHTDTVGSPEMNKALSERRAATVVEYLAAKWNIDRAKIQAVGMGEEKLMVPTGPNVAEPRNRRVTVVNLGA